MAKFHVTSNGQTFEITAPDSDAAQKAWDQSNGTSTTEEVQGALAPAAPAAPQPEGWSASRVLRDLGHYPAMLGEAAANAAIGTANLPANVFNVASWAGNKVGNALFGDELPPPQIPTIPYADFGANAKPQGTGEALTTGAFGGATSALLGSGVSRAGTALASSGREIAAELPKLLREAGVLGAVPGAAVAGVGQTSALDGLDPHVRTVAETLIGAGAAVASHSLVGGDPVGAVAAKLGTAKNSDEAGVVAKANAKEWREGLNEKIEGLKKIESPTVPPGDVTKPYPTGPSGHYGDFDTGPGTGPPAEPMMFGKVPLQSAEINNAETMRVTHALATEGGAYEDFYHNFVSKLPEEAQRTFDNIALSNKPIVMYPPQRAAPSPMQTYREGEIPDAMNTYGPAVEGSVVPPAQGPGLRGGYEVPRASPGPAEPPVAGGPEPWLHSGPSPDTGYRPNWQFGLNNPPEGVSPQALSGASPSPPPRWSKRNARGQFVSKGYGIEEAQTAPPPQAERGGPWGPANAPEGATASPPANPLVPYAPPPTNPPPGSVSPPGVTIGFAAPLADALKLRSTIGEWISDPPRLMPKGIDEAHAKAYYAGISADIKRTMDHYGAGAEWDGYNTDATSIYRAGNLLSKFANTTNDAKDSSLAGKAVQNIWATMGKDSSEIATLRAQVPKAADELAAAFLRTSPEKWNGLPEATQKALVPNPFDRLTLSMHATAKSTSAEEIARSRNLVYGGTGGQVLQELLQPHGQAEGSTSLLTPGGWTVAGILAPEILRFAGHVKENPRMLNVPLIGGVAGANALQAPAGSPLLAPK